MGTCAVFAGTEQAGLMGIVWSSEADKIWLLLLFQGANRRDAEGGGVVPCTEKPVRITTSTSFQKCRPRGRVRRPLPPPMELERRTSISCCCLASRHACSHQRTPITFAAAHSRRAHHLLLEVVNNRPRENLSFFSPFQMLSWPGDAGDAGAARARRASSKSRPCAFVAREEGRHVAGMALLSHVFPSPSP